MTSGTMLRTMTWFWTQRRLKLSLSMFQGSMTLCEYTHLTIKTWRWSTTPGCWGWYAPVNANGHNTQYIIGRAYGKLWFLRQLKNLGASHNSLLDVYKLFNRSNLEFALNFMGRNYQRERSTQECSRHHPGNKSSLIWRISWQVRS